MASGTINFTQSHSSGSYIDGKIEWLSTTNPNNISYVNVALYVRKGNTDMTLTIPTDGTWKYTIAFDGTSIVNDGGSVYKAVLEDWVLLYERKQIPVTHNANGTKSIEVTSSITAPTGTSFEGQSISNRTTIKLDTIDRTTKIDSLKCSTAYLDGTITALYTPVASDLVNRRHVYVNKGGVLTLIHSENLGAKSAGVQQKKEFEFTDSELSKIYKLVTDTAKVNIRVVFQTYTSGYGTKVGDDRYLEITLSIPAAIGPTASLVVTRVNTNSWVASKGIYAAGLSGATVALAYTGADWTSIKSYNIVYNGTTYNAAQLNITTLKTAGSIQFTSKVVDSRGRSATATESITVLPYSQPVVSSITLERGTYGTKWTADEDGTDVRVVFKTTLGLVSEGNKYKATFELDDVATTAAGGTVSGLSSATDYTVYFRGIDSEVSHTLKITATDSVGKTGSATITIPTTHITVEYNVSGKGIAFGKTSEHDAFECAFPAEFTNTVKRIKENGTVISLDDTGWIDLGLSANVAERSTAAGHAGKGCKYRVVNGNHVYVAFCCEFTFSGSAVTVNLNSIPSAYRPANHIYAMCATGGRAITRCIVNSSGNVLVDWVQIISSAEQTTSSTVGWVDGYIDYFI